MRPGFIISRRKRHRADGRVLAATLLAAATVQASASTATESEDPATPRPNVVVVVADDVGFTDLGAYGSEIRTPHIDAIASRGVLFTNFHASPMCSPSRAMLLTGVDSHLTDVASLHVATPLRHRGRPGYRGELSTDVVTIASRLRAAGYRTYLSGKWNLGHAPTSLPSARGFDRTFALDATGADNFEKKPYLPIYGEPPWFADGEPTDLPADFYSSEHLVDRLVEFIDTDRVTDGERRPFFAYLAFQAVHLPVQAPREFIEGYEGVYDEGWEALRRERHRRAVEAGVFPPGAVPSTTPEQADWEALSPDEKAFAAKNMAVNAAMLEAMDHHFGRLVEYLGDEGLLENTVFVVLSDNGPEAGDPGQSAQFGRWAERVGYRRDLETLGEKGSYGIIGPHFARAAAAPLAYYKFHGGEGGIRVPLIIAGPGVEARGIAPAFTFVTDLVPTILELTGAGDATPSGKHPIDGRSLAPALLDPSALVHPPREAVGFETAGHRGVFKGDHKLVRVGAPVGDGRWRLFDLAEDPGETRDLAAEQPERFSEMLADYEAYAERVGVLEVPAFYSPTRQLAINYFYDRAKETFMKTRVWTGAGLAVVVLAAAVWLGLPRVLVGLGLHAHYEIPAIDLAGHRALIVTTSHDTLGDSGKATGVWASEMTVPYYAFTDAGMTVDVASIRGGAIPVERQSVRWPVASPADKRYLRDAEFRSKVEDSIAIADVDGSAYDIVFLAGGWGAAYDLGQSEELGRKVSEAYARESVVGGVCHGPLGLLRAVTPGGEPLVRGRRVSAVSDKQIEELGITFTPMHPERDLRAAGALFESDTRFRDILASRVVVDGRLVTGQNQNSGAETAHRMMEVLLGSRPAYPEK